MDLRSLEELEEAFKALSNINRLKLLLELQRPKGYNEIKLTPSRPGPEGPEDRPISRQAVRHHIEELRELGVVAETDTDERRRQFVVDRARLYAIVEKMRDLATVEPSVDPSGATMALDGGQPVPMPDGPHLVLVRGVEEGQAYPLQEEQERFVIGRDPSADVVLDYDAFVSGEHAHVLQRPEGHVLKDLESNRNGTLLNWRRIKRGGVAPLSAGDVIGMGRSLLVFRS